MQDVKKHLVFVSTVNVVGALDAEIERRRALVGELDGHVVVVAHLGRAGVARVRALVPLAHERRPLRCGAHTSSQRPTQATHLPIRFNLNAYC